MELVWNVLYLVAALGGGLVCAIIASKKGYRDMLWFLSAFFCAMFHPILLVLPMGIILMLKDLNKLDMEVEKEKLALEKEALEKGINKAQVLDPETIKGLNQRIKRAEALGNWIGLILAVGPGIVLFFGRGI